MADRPKPTNATGLSGNRHDPAGCWTQVCCETLWNINSDIQICNVKKNTLKIESLKIKKLLEIWLIRFKGWSQFCMLTISSGLVCYQYVCHLIGRPLSAVGLWNCCLKPLHKFFYV